MVNGIAGKFFFNSGDTSAVPMHDVCWKGFQFFTRPRRPTGVV